MGIRNPTDLVVLASHFLMVVFVSAMSAGINDPYLSWFLTGAIILAFVVYKMLRVGDRKRGLDRN